MVGVQPLEGRMRAAALSLTSQGEASSSAAMPMAMVSRAHVQQQPLRPHHIQAPGMLQVSASSGVASSDASLSTVLCPLIGQGHICGKSLLWCAGTAAASEQVHPVKSKRVYIWTLGHCVSLTITVNCADIAMLLRSGNDFEGFVHDARCLHYAIFVQLSALTTTLTLKHSHP